MGNDKPSDKKPSSDGSEVPTAAELNNAHYLDDHYGTAGVMRCADGANDYLRGIGKYDFAWDETGILEPKFDQLIEKVKSPGILTMVSRKAKLQNGFGAFQHITLFCDYDTQAQTVLGYDVAQQ